MSPASDPPRSTRVQSVERAAALLRAVATATGAAASATALAEQVGLNRTTTWRMLTALEQERLVVRDRDTGSYSLGFGLLDLASLAGSSGLVRSAETVLRRLAAQAGETAALGMMRDGALTYVAEAASGAVVAAVWQGREVPLHATSTGKVWLAHSEPEDLRRRLGVARGGRLTPYTSTTITSLVALEKELRLTRERGYAVCRGEYESSAWGVSAPVLDLAGRPAAIVSVWGPSERLGEDRFERLGGLAVGAATEIAGRRGLLHPPQADDTVTGDSQSRPEEA